jgi:hypothetical protein
VSANDQLEAAKLRATLGTSLLTTTGTAVAAGLALVAFATGLHDVGSKAPYFWVVGGALLFASAFTGGFGIKQLSARGSEGDWSRARSAYFFGAQAALFVLETMLFAIGTISAFNGEPRTSRDDGQDRDLVRISTQLETLTAENERLRARLGRAERKLARGARK